MHRHSCGRGFCSGECNTQDPRERDRKSPAFPSRFDGMVPMPPQMAPPAAPPADINANPLNQPPSDMPPYIPGGFTSDTSMPFTPDQGGGDASQPYNPDQGDGQVMTPQQPDLPAYNARPDVSNVFTPFQPNGQGTVVQPQGQGDQSGAVVQPQGQGDQGGFTTNIMMPDQNTSTSVNEPIATDSAPPQYAISNPGMINVAYTPPPAPVPDAKDQFFGMMRLSPPTSTIQGTASTGACPGCGRSYTGASARSGTVARCPYCGTAMTASLGGVTRPSSRVERTPADKLVERLVKNIQGTARTSGVGQTYLPGGPRVSSTPAEDLIARGLKNSQLNWRGGQSAGVHGVGHADMRGATKTHADHLVERQIAMAHIRRNPAAVHAHVSGIVNHPASTAGVSIVDPALVEYRSGGISYGALYRSLRGRGYNDAQIAAALRMR